MIKKEKYLNNSANMGLEVELALSVTNLIGTGIKAVRKEFQMANSSDLSRHLDDSEELCGLQTPQMQVVGFASGSQDSAISTFKNTNPVRNQEQLNGVCSGVQCVQQCAVCAACAVCAGCAAVLACSLL